MAVFTVEEYGQHPTFCPPPVRRKTGRGKTMMQLVLLVFSLLALCGAALEMYYLRKVESSLSATQDMINENATAQKMIFRRGFRDGPPMPSAHVTGLMVVDSSPHSSLQWEHERGLAFLHEVGYNNGSLVCPKSGIYFIYSKLQLGLSKCPQNTEDTLFTHGVFMRRSTSNIALVENMRRFCDTQGSLVWRGSSFVCGSVMLAKGDEVYVSMSHKHLIRVQTGTATFFGMFMVSTVHNET